MSKTDILSKMRKKRVERKSQQMNGILSTIFFLKNKNSHHEKLLLKRTYLKC